MKSTGPEPSNECVQRAFPRQRQSANFTIPALSRHVTVFSLIHIPALRVEIKRYLECNKRGFFSTSETCCISLLVQETPAVLTSVSTLEMEQSCCMPIVQLLSISLFMRH